MARKHGNTGGGRRAQPRSPASAAAAERPSAPLSLDRDELVAMMQDHLQRFATEVGLKVACLLLEEEMAAFDDGVSYENGSVS